MDTTTKILLILLASPLLLFILHIPVSRIFKKHPPQTVLIFLIVFFQPLLFSIAWFTVLREISSLFQLYSAAVYFLITTPSLSVIYFFVFGMGETARRIRLLNEIKRSGSLSEQEITDLYKGDDILVSRLERLHKMGQLYFDGQKYHLKKGWLYFGAVFVDVWSKILASE